MPNFGLVVDASYDPISYEQYVAPFKEYITMYDKVADLYDTLAMEASKWEKLAKSDKDLDAYKLFLKYDKALRNVVNDLVENGLNSKTRGMLSEIKKRYVSEIQPIEDAYNYIQEKTKAQEQIKAKNPRVIFDTDFSTDVGITDVINNPHMSYNYIDLDSVLEDASKAATALSSRNININDNPLLGTAYKMQILGYALPDIVSYIKEFSSEYPEIYNLYNNLKTKYGSYGSLVDDAIVLGMLQGYTANANPVQVGSVVGGSSTSKKSGSEDDSLLITDYITVENDAGDNKRIAIDTFTQSATIEDGYYPLDKDGNKVKNADGTAAKFNDPRVKKGQLKQVQTSGNHYIITTEDGMPLKQDGKIVGYDSSKLYFDIKDWSVKDTPQKNKVSSIISGPIQISVNKKGEQESSKVLDFSIVLDRKDLGVPITAMSEILGIKLPKGVSLDNCDIYVRAGKKESKYITIIPREDTKIVEEESEVGY